MREELEKHWARTRRFMDTDALLVMQKADMFYLADTVDDGILWFPIEGEPILFLRYGGFSGRSETSIRTIIPFQQLSELSDHVRKPVSLGLELDVLPVQLYRELTAIFNTSRITDASNALRLARAVKTPFELEQIRAASRMLDTVFRAIPSWLKEGMAEYELAAEIQYKMRLDGHQGLTRVRRFNMEMDYGFVSFGDSASYPTNFDGPVGSQGLYPAVPGIGGRKRLERGVPIMVDILGGHGGYLADGSRAYSIGPISTRIQETHRYILELNGWIEEQLKPGKIPSAVYSDIQERIAKTPYAPFFMGAGENQARFVAHGIGLELDEIPVVAPKFDMPLEPRMILAVEPKIFYPNIGGTGTENTYVITEGGCERLTVSPQDFTSIS